MNAIDSTQSGARSPDIAALNAPSKMGSQSKSCLRRVALGLALAVTLIGLAVLIGWRLNIAALKSVLPGLVSMKPNTALGLLLSGASLTLLASSIVKKHTRYLAAAVTFVIVLLGAVTLGEYVLDWDLGIDNAMFPESAQAIGTSHPGRMSPATALCFVFAGVALLIASLRTGVRLRQPLVGGLSVAVTGIGALALAGYVIEAQFKHRLWNYTGTAVHTALGLVLVGCALMALVRSEGGLTWTLDRISTAVILGAVVLMTLAAGSAYNFARQLREVNSGVSRTQELLRAIQEVETNIASIESGQRGHIITGTEDFLHRFRKGRTRVADSLAKVRELTADNPVQQSRLAELEPIIARRIDFADQTISSRSQQGFAAAQQLVATGTCTQLSDAIYALLEEMRNDEFALLDKRKTQSDATSVTTFLLLPLGLFLSLTSVSVGVFLLNAGVGERIRAEQAASDSKARLEGIVSSAMDAIISVDGDQKIVLFNTAAEKIFRCPAADAIGRPIDTFIPPKLREEHRRHILGFGQTGVTSRSMRSLGVLKGLRADGEEFPIEASISQIEAAGQTFFTVILRDITERKRAEEELRESQTQLEAIVENLSEGLVVSGLDGELLHFNRAAVEIHEFASAEEGRRHVRHFADTFELTELNGEVLAVDEWPLRRILRGETLRDVELRIKRINSGWQRIFNYGGALVYNEAGKAIAAIVTVSDITKRKQAEAALRESEASLKEAQRIAHLGSYVFDFVTGTWQSSEILDEVFGIDHTYDRSMAGWLALVHPDDQATMANYVENELGREQTFDREFRIIRQSDQAERWIWGRASLERDTEGRPMRARGTSQDITERKRAEQEIRQLTAELEQRVATRTSELEAANKELEAFSYSVSHDLRAPLRAVDGFSQAIIEDYAPQLPEEGKRYLQTIRESAQRMGELIDDLLSFSRLSRLPLNTRVVDTAKLVRNVVEDLSAQLNGRQVDFRIGDLPTCRGDAALLRQVWINLVSNALKFTSKREAAVVEIGSVREQSGDVFFVRDNGTGFDMKYAGKLFGVFQRLHRVEDFEGTGVGLAIVQRVVHRHGGRVWADAAVDHGAAFYFTIGGETQS